MNCSSSDVGRQASPLKRFLCSLYPPSGPADMHVLHEKYTFLVYQHTEPKIPVCEKFKFSTKENLPGACINILDKEICKVQSVTFEIQIKVKFRWCFQNLNDRPSDTAHGFVAFCLETSLAGWQLRYGKCELSVCIQLLWSPLQKHTGHFHRLVVGSV